MVATRSFTTSNSARLERLRLPQAPIRANVRKVMASPPTITGTTSHTISSPRSWSAVIKDGSVGKFNPIFSYRQAGGPVIRGTIYPEDGFLKFTSTNYGTSGQGQICAGFRVGLVHRGSELEFQVKGGANIWVKINGEYVSLAPLALANDGNIYYVYIPFGSSDTREVELISSGNHFAGVFTGATDTIIHSAPKGPKCIVLGDSFTEGTGPTNALNAYTAWLSDYLGWDDIRNSGVGSNGYLAAPDGKLKFRDRLFSDVTPFYPDVVIVAGGINDGGSGAAAVAAEAVLLIAALRANTPGVTIIGVSPFSAKGGGSLLTLSYDINDALRAVYQAAGCLYLDLLEQPLPVDFTAFSSTLAASCLAGATSISLNNAPPVGSTLKFTNNDRSYVKAVSGAGPYTITIDSVVAAHSSGEAVVQVGGSLWVGSGRVGTTTGFGNCDTNVSSDGVHPSNVGSQDIAATITQLFWAALGRWAALG